MNEQQLIQAKEKKRIKKKLGMKCRYCNCNNPLFLTIDHILPKCRGGGDDEKNKQILCRSCNQLKGGLNNQEFLKYLKGLNLLKETAKIKITFPAQMFTITFNAEHRPDFFIPEKTLEKSPQREWSKTLNGENK